jgi:hypothetical protein
MLAVESDFDFGNPDTLNQAVENSPKSQFGSSRPVVENLLTQHEVILFDVFSKDNSQSPPHSRLHQ